MIIWISTLDSPFLDRDVFAPLNSGPFDVLDRNRWTATLGSCPLDRDHFDYYSGLFLSLGP